MEHLEPSELFAMIVAMLVAAKLFGALAQRIGQPAVLGELIAGIVVGGSVLGLVDPHIETIEMLSHIGVVVLLLVIGLETDLKAMASVGVTALVVAVVGVALPFGLGYVVCHMMGMPVLVSIMAGAALTATSVGITARVLSDLGQLKSPEGQIILGAAVIDDILGLVILAVVAGMVDGGDPTVTGVALTTAKAFGFLIAALAIGFLIVPWLVRLASKVDLPGTPTIFAMILALGLAWLAEESGSAAIIGAFVAGVVLRKTTWFHEIEAGVITLGHFFVPLFFVHVGALVELGAMNPMTEHGRWAIVVGSVLIVVGVIGKLAAGYAPFWFHGHKTVIGVGMIPRGEVGLIFAQIGLQKGVFDSGIFGGVTLMVIFTTFLAPPILKALLTEKEAPKSGPEPEVIQDLVTEA